MTPEQKQVHYKLLENLPVRTVCEIDEFTKRVKPVLARQNRIRTQLEVERESGPVLVTIRYNNIKIAARRHGVTVQTVRDWIKHGRAKWADE